MASNVVTSTNFNAQKISFSAMKALDSGGKQAYVNYDGGMFVVQTPSCRLPFGMSAFDKAGPVKYSVELSLDGYNEAGSKIKQFHDTMSSLDEFMIEQGVRNSRQWFKGDLSRDVIKAFYTPMIRYAKDKDGNTKPYPPNIKLTLRKKRDSDEFDVHCYDDQRTLYRGIPLEELLVRGAQVTSLIKCTGVWVAGSKYGLSWKLEQAMITSLPQSRNFAFVEDEVEAAPRVSRTSAPQKQVVADEEEEEEEDDEEEFVPPAKVAAKAPVKSVVAAVMPSTLDDAADDAEPIPVPKKATTTVLKKKVLPKK